MDENKKRDELIRVLIIQRNEQANRSAELQSYVNILESELREIREKEVPEVNEDETET